MPGSSLAVDRMSDAALWRRLRDELALLDPADVPFTRSGRVRRQGAYSNCLAITHELKMRGVQLGLLADSR